LSLRKSDGYRRTAALEPSDERKRISIGAGNRKLKYIGRKFNAIKVCTQKAISRNKNFVRPSPKTPPSV